MKYYIVVFTDNRNHILQTNSLKEAMDWYADKLNKVLKDG